MASNVFSDLLKKEMTRKEFLLHIGLGLFVITGIAGVLKVFSDPNLISRRNQVSSGFGSGSYGGVKKG